VGQAARVGCLEDTPGKYSIIGKVLTRRPYESS
jgi:hypothetical protein